MRAFVLTKYGDASATELRDIPAPTAGAGEVCISVKAAGLNPVDFKIRQGGLRVIQRHKLPVVLGCELSGVVSAVGAGVTRFRVGDEVYTRVAKERLGAFAEVACVQQELVAKSRSAKLARLLPISSRAAPRAKSSSPWREPQSKLCGGAEPLG